MKLRKLTVSSFLVAIGVISGHIIYTYGNCKSFSGTAWD